MATDEAKKKKARVCVCGNFQQKKPTDLFYTANTDISRIRVVLAEAAQKPDWGTRSLDVTTAFLNAPMPEGGRRISLCETTSLVGTIQAD